jgi:hypothetical protein
MQEYSARGKARITAIRPPTAPCATAPWISTGSLNGHGGSAIASRIWAFERAAPATKQPLILKFVRFWCVAAIVSPKRFVIVITISEVRQKDTERAYEEFFREEFRSQRLGRVGQWFGEAKSVLGLSQPVSLKVFSNLVRGLTPDGDKMVLQDGDNPNRTALWQIDYNGSQSLSTLWAIAPASWTAKVESVHVSAAHYVLGQINAEIAADAWLRGSYRKLSDRPNILAALFSYGATHDHTPHLKATAFVLTHGFIKDGSLCKFDTYDINARKGQLSDLHDFALQHHCLGSLGLVKEDFFIRELRIAGVPQEVVRKFFFGPTDSQRQHSAKPLEEMELFAKWKAEGGRLGWGVSQAAALLRESGRQKYWADLRADVRSKIHASARTLQAWKPSWSSKRRVQEEPQQENKHVEVERPKHRH